MHILYHLTHLITMVLYRGVKRLLISEINHLFQNTDEIFLDYGKATSYTSEKSLALDYANGDHKWGFILTIDFHPVNPLYITEKNQISEDDVIFNYGIFINGKTYKKKELANYARSNNHDCIIFETDDSEGHVLIIDTNSKIELKEIELYSDNNLILTNIQPVNLIDSNGLLLVPFNKINELDSILKELKY